MWFAFCTLFCFYALSYVSTPALWPPRLDAHIAFSIYVCALDCLFVGCRVLLHKKGWGLVPVKLGLGHHHPSPNNCAFDSCLFVRSFCFSIKYSFLTSIDVILNLSDAGSAVFSNCCLSWVSSYLHFYNPLRKKCGIHGCVRQSSTLANFRERQQVSVQLWQFLADGTEWLWTVHWNVVWCNQNGALCEYSL